MSDTALSIPPCSEGLERAWRRCHRHQVVSYYDFTPYSLSTAIGEMPCGCDIRDCESITEPEALSYLVTPSATTQKPAPDNLAIIRDGYLILYHQGESNHCPGCGKSQWMIGRSTAECAFCGTALQLAAPADPTERDILPAETPPTKIQLEKGPDHGITSPQG